MQLVAIEPALRENDWAGAAIGAAQGLSASLNGEEITAPEVTPGEAEPSGGGGFNPFWIFILGVLVVGLMERPRSRPPN